MEVGQGWISPIFLDSGRWLVCRWTLITDEGYRITVLTNSINLRPPYQGKCLLNRIGVSSLRIHAYTISSIYVYYGS